MVVLEHGIFAQEQRREFVEALVKEQQKACADAHLAGEPRTRAEEMTLRRAALQARLKWRKANNLYTWLEEQRSRWESLTSAEKI